LLQPHRNKYLQNLHEILPDGLPQFGWNVRLMGEFPARWVFYYETGHKEGDFRRNDSSYLLLINYMTNFTQLT